MRILSCTSLAADLNIRNSRPSASATYNGIPHTFSNDFIIFAIHHRVPFICVKGIQRGVLHLLHYMRSNKISPVSDGRRQITNLQWRSQHFTLPDRNGDDSTGTPTFTMIFVIIFTVRQKTSIFPRQVNAQLIAVSHRHQVVLPDFKRLSHARITPAAIDHIPQPPTKKRVTGSSQRIGHI